MCNAINGSDGLQVSAQAAAHYGRAEYGVSAAVETSQHLWGLLDVHEEAVERHGEPLFNSRLALALKHRKAADTVLIHIRMVSSG